MPKPIHRNGRFCNVCCHDDATHVVALDVSSPDGGRSLTGTMTYAGEGPIGFRGTRTMANTYSVVNQWGGDHAPWHPGGDWVLGCRGKQGVVAITAKGDGHGLHGTMTYAGEGKIGLALMPSVVKVAEPA